MLEQTPNAQGCGKDSDADVEKYLEMKRDGAIQWPLGFPAKNFRGGSS